MVYRLILPDWAKLESPSLHRVLEGQFSDADIRQHNQDGYNVYFLPNYPSVIPKGVIDGSHIDKFEYVFVDMDLKEQKHADKDSFIASLSYLDLPPTRIVDSGNGIHVYWRVTDLDAMSFLKLQRRLMRRLNTDEAVAKIYQLMRVPNTINNKQKDDPKLCECIYESNEQYTCEQMDAKLPVLTKEDEQYCTQHFDKTYKLNRQEIKVDDVLPIKFCKLISSNKEIKKIWSGEVDNDRSAADYRLGHIMFAHGFTKEEAMSVLVNAAKALERAPIHRVAYAQTIIDKIWTFEMSEARDGLNLSKTVREILVKGEGVLKGTRFPCWPYIDATHHGFRLGQVIGLVAGSGVGKTAMALNMFLGFVQNNPDYEHFFVPLEQPENEIADRWKTMCGDNAALFDKVHVLSNYAEDGSFRHLSFEEIKTYILKFQELSKKKVGCIVIDHIGALKKKGKEGENQDLMTICHEMKAFAIQTNTLLIMQSQSSREKAGIGDLELNKDAAYGTVYFESYCDYLITIWQPLKRCYSNPGCPTVTTFKFCKIRHKKRGLDSIKEDVCYNLYFDSGNEHLRELTQDEEKSLDYYMKQAVTKRKLDRKTDVLPYESITWTKEGVENGKSDTDKNLI